MAKYIATAKTWLSHECRMVEEGEEFETTFPKAPDGKDMRLGSNLMLAKDKVKGKAGDSEIV